MAVTVKKKMGSAMVEITGAESLKGMFKALAMFAEILADTKCGCCNSEQIKHEVRTVTKEGGTFDYYGLRCTACGAQLNFGQNKDGKGLFSKRDEHPDTAGWYVWSRDGNSGGGGGQRDEQYQPPASDDDSIPF